MRICIIEGCGRKHLARGWCSKHYANWRKTGKPVAENPYYTNPDDSFRARTMPVTEAGCLLWMGAVDTDGYGSIWINSEGKLMLAHRYAWERVNGPIPDGIEIDHICHTPACCNIKHLRLATRSQNSSYKGKLRSDNTSGYRGVSWSIPIQRWIVQVGGKYFGSYDNVHKAGEISEQARQEIFKEFAGK